VRERVLTDQLGGDLAGDDGVDLAEPGVLVPAYASPDDAGPVWTRVMMVDRCDIE
jgi:hypothetical protein